MLIWQVDFYKCPQTDVTGQALWELLICDATRTFTYNSAIPQSEVNSSWLASQFQLAGGGKLPDVIQVFRPQSLSLVEQAANSLGIKVEATRYTSALKLWLSEKQYPTAVDKPPPTPLPENLWGEEWRLAAMSAGDLIEYFSDRPIPILRLPEFLLPINKGLASTVTVPGVVIYGGRQSMRLARWLEVANPVSLNYIPGTPDGLILEAGLADRWVVATFEDKEVSAAAKVYEQRKQITRGLHFLVVQPDDSGVTHSGFWLLGSGE